ncbi:exopolysaccharide biosynthesis protein [Rickettsiaceae bacterium]|nr:exopolysaccharide biosynthesis protein [Rickettsiaceae bacterium]
MFIKKPKPKLLDTTSVSENLQKIAAKHNKGKTRIADIMEDFHENGLLLAMIFFALPVAIPLPYPPGFTTVMGIPLLILSIQMLFGSKRVRLPKRVNEYEIHNSTLKMISDKFVPIVKSVEKYVKPRFSFARSVYCEQFVGFVCIIASIAVAIPWPLTNAIPALGISVMALGLLNRDGATIITGLLISMIGVVIAVTVVVASWVAIKYAIVKSFSIIF